MKLTKRLLAIVLAAAMLVGMVAISSSAVQLDDDVPSLTWDDCIIDKDSNPYTVKLGYKIYKVDTDSGEYELLADTTAGNDTYDVKAEPGDVLRVECWAQTNFHTSAIQLTPAYNNAWLLPTTMDYTVVATTASYPLKVAKKTEITAMGNAFPKMVDFCEEYGKEEGDGTFEAPVFINEALTQAKGQINHNGWNGLRAVLPKDWWGSGTAEGNWVNKNAVDQWGNSIVDANGHLIYNVYQLGIGVNATGTEEWTGYAAVLNVYQPIGAFNITVAEGATGTAKLFYPESSYYNTANATTSFTAYDYDAVQASPDGNGNWDDSIPQVCSSGISPAYANKVKYDGVEADKNWIVTNATITVGGATEPEEPSTDETTTEAAKADLSALQAAIAAAKAADTANCTSASVKALNDALAAAEALNVEGTLATEQGAIDAATKALNTAIAGLKKLGNCDYSKLDAAINTVVDTTNCTSASVKAYNDALAAAKAIARGMIADEAGANQAKIDAATKALNTAIAGLTKLGACDYAALDAAIAAYEAKKADSYKYANWADYTALYEAAKAVTRDMIADEAGANQKAIDAAAKALNDYALVEKTVDYTAWNAAAAKVPADLSAYTPNSVAAFEAAKAAAETAKDAAVAAYDQAALDKAAADLEAAIELLAAKADKTALAAAIARATALNADAYTPDSWAAADLANVLAAANAVNADDNAAQDAVDAQVAAIEAAEAKLVKKADKSALTAAIEAAKALDEDDYTPESWTAADLAAAIEAAEAVNNNANATDAAVADAIAALEEAAAKLAEKADKTALKAAIDTLPDVAEDEAVSATWEAYEDALADANAVYANANATQDDVNAAEANLLAAIAGVKALGECDYTKLEEALNLEPEYDEEYYDAAEWEAYQDALVAADAIDRDMLADEAGVNQAKIDAAAKALTDAFNALGEPKFVDRTALEEALALTPEYGEEYYDEDTWAAWEEAVAAGFDAYEGVEGEPDVEWARNEVAEAAKAIVDALAALELKAADYSAVEAMKGKIPADLSTYTDASVKALNDAVAAVVEGLDITKQAEVDAMAKAIEVAIGNLQKKAADYTALNAAIARKDALNANDWTAETWADVVDAYTAATGIAKDLTIDDQATIDAAAKALNDAIDALEEAPRDAVVTKVTAKQEYFKVGDTVEFDFFCSVTGVTKLQVVYSSGTTSTYTRTHSSVTKITDNGDGTETWTIAIKIIADTTPAKAKAKLGKVWEKEGYPFVFQTKQNPATAEDKEIKSAEIINANGDVVTEFKAKETVTIRIVAGPDTLRIRFVSEGGSTSTYTRTRAYQNADGNWVWEIKTSKTTLKTYKFDLHTAGKNNKLSDEGTDLVYTVVSATSPAGPSTGNAADIVVSAKVAKARLLVGDKQTVTVVTDKKALGVKIVDANGSVYYHTKDTSIAVDNGDGTLTWTFDISCTYAATYTFNVEALYSNQWMNNGTTITYRVVY